MQAVPKINCVTQVAAVVSNPRTDRRMNWVHTKELSLPGQQEKKI